MLVFRNAMDREVLDGFRLATNGEIFVNTHALLKQRFRAGLPITSYPELLRSFLQAKVGCQGECHMTCKVHYST